MAIELGGNYFEIYDVITRGRNVLQEKIQYLWSVSLKGLSLTLF